MIVRAALLLLFACGSTASPRPPAATHADAEPPIATATHSCSDAALGIENATKSVRDPDRAVFETLRRHCLDDRWPARAIDCFATMAEGDLGTCAHDLPDATREPIFAALSGREPGGNLVVTRARLQQLQVGVPECDRFVSAVTAALTCEKLSIDTRVQLGNETVDFWSLPTSRLSHEDRLRISAACGHSLASLQQHALGAGCML